MSVDTLTSGAEIVTTRLDTRGLGQRARRDAYLGAINHSLDTDFLDEACDAALTGFHLGDLHVIRLEASARRSTRTPALIERDRYDGVSFQYAVSGRSVGRAGRRSVSSDPGTVMVLDFAQPFTMTDQDHRIVVNVAVPRRALRARNDDPATLHGLVLQPPAINLFRDLLLSIVGDRDVIAHGEGKRLGRMMIDATEIMLDRGGIAEQASDDPSIGALLTRAHALMDTRIGSQDLTPEWLGDRLGLSRSELYRLFRASGGVSKAIWHRRLDAARAAFAEPRDLRRIGEIAYALGFSSEAHFARAFRTRFGTTARDLRAASRRGTESND